MTNQQLQILLTLRDEVSAKWQSLTTKMAADSRELMASVKQNWLAISAGAVAAFAVIKKAWDFAEEFLKTEQARETFRSAVESMGMDATRVFNDINDKAAGLLDDSDILAASNRAISLGVPITALGDLMTIARAKSRDLGITAKDAFELITEAVGKSSERKLKEIGLTIDLKKESDFLKATLISGAEALHRVNLETLTELERMQKLKVTFKEIEETFGGLVLRIKAGAVVFIQAVTAAIWQVAQTILLPFMLIEEGMRKLGLTTSWAITHAFVTAGEGAKHFKEEAEAAFKLMLSSNAELAKVMSGTQARTRETADGLRDVGAKIEAIKVKEIVFVSDEQEKRFSRAVKDAQRIVDFMRQSKGLNTWLIGENDLTNLRKVQEGVKSIQLDVKKITDADIFESFKKEMPLLTTTMSALAETLHQNFSTAWEKIFGEANSFAEQFFQNMARQMFDNFVSKAIGWMGEIFSGIPGIGGILGLFFHGGGTVPKAHEGAYIDAPSTHEFPIMVRGGETIRTERQEAALQRNQPSGGNTFVFEFNTPVPHAEWVVASIRQQLRKTGLPIDKLIVNQSGGAALG